MVMRMLSARGASLGAILAALARPAGTPGGNRNVPPSGAGATAATLGLALPQDGQTMPSPVDSRWQCGQTRIRIQPTTH